jgi:hypothetical protein
MEWAFRMLASASPLFRTERDHRGDLCRHANVGIESAGVGESSGGTRERDKSEEPEFHGSWNDESVWNKEDKLNP